VAILVVPTPQYTPFGRARWHEIATGSAAPHSKIGRAALWSN
jgi:hypothetical protein